MWRALASDTAGFAGCFDISGAAAEDGRPFGEADMIAEQLEALCDRGPSARAASPTRFLPLRPRWNGPPALAVTRADAGKVHRGRPFCCRTGGAQ